MTEENLNLISDILEELKDKVKRETGMDMLIMWSAVEELEDQPYKQRDKDSLKDIELSTGYSCSKNILEDSLDSMISKMLGCFYQSRDYMDLYGDYDDYNKPYGDEWQT